MPEWKRQFQHGVQALILIVRARLPHPAVFHLPSLQLKYRPPRTSSAGSNSIASRLESLAVCCLGYCRDRNRALQVHRLERNLTASLPAPKLQRLTTSGRASDAAISPDGKYVAHVKSDAGQQSLWLRQVVTPSDTQIVPPSTQNYSGITFSKDGNYIYYRLGEPNLSARTLYQVPTLGGASRKMIENVASPITLSPDGTRLAFMRSNVSSGETALVVANADGTGERQVAVRKSPKVSAAAGRRGRLTGN